MPPRRRATDALQTTLPAECTTIRVALYRRASTDEGNQPYSLEAQDQRLRPYVASQPGWVVAADYVERASGKDIDGRPELKRLLRDAAAGKFDLVLVARIDRWSRSLIDLLDTVEHLASHGVAFHSATEHFDTNTPLGKLLLQMLGMFAEFERSMIIDRIQRGNAAKIAQGIPLTSRVGYGLTVDADGRIAADPDTIGIVRRIFDEYTTRERGVKAIAVGLNEDGIPGAGARGWSPQSVSRVLRNRAFVGEVLHRDTWHPGAHDPIVDLDQFEAAQAIADKRAADTSAAAARRGEFVLTGTIRCAHCRSAYVGTSGTGRSGQAVRYYSCGTARRYGSTRCTGPSLPAVELEELVTEALLACYSDSALFEEAISAHLAGRASRQQPLTEQLHAVTKAIEGKERVLGRYQADYEAERLSAERYEARAAELDEELLALRATAADLELQLTGPDLPTVPTPEELNQLRAHLTTGIRHGDINVRKALFGALVESLVVHDRDDIRPTFRLYDPGATTVLAADSPSSTADRETAVESGAAGVGGVKTRTDGLRFASRPPRWS